MVGKLIGTKGATIQEIQSTSGTRIRVEGTHVHIFGNPTAVETAKQRIREIITPPVKICVNCPKHLTGKLIGPRGRTINSIREKTGANISIEESKVTITGKSWESVETAKEEILRITEPPKSYVYCPEVKPTRTCSLYHLFETRTLLQNLTTTVVTTYCCWTYLFWLGHCWTSYWCWWKCNQRYREKH